MAQGLSLLLTSAAWELGSGFVHWFKVGTWDCDLNPALEGTYLIPCMRAVGTADQIGGRGNFGGGENDADRRLLAAK